MKRNIIVFLLSFILPSFLYSQNQDLKDGIADNDEMAVSIVQSSENVYNDIYPIAKYLTVNHIGNCCVEQRYLDNKRENKMTSVQLFDAFGRPYINIDYNATPRNNAIYSVTEYDNMDRKQKVWLPRTFCKMSSFKGLCFDIDVVDADESRLKNNGYYDYNDYSTFSDVLYDAIGRQKFISTPGDDWNTKCIKGKNIKYITNKNGSVKKYFIDKYNNVTYSYYPANTLEGTLTLDEDGNAVEVYKDFRGNVILERRDGNNDTYFVYENGLLKTVIPPLYQTKKQSSLLYRYDYDGYGRCIKKTLPGNVVIKYWYDKYGRMSFMQDGRLTGTRQFRFYLYDGLSRMVVQGLTTDTVGKSDARYIANVSYDSGNAAVSGTGYKMLTSARILSPTIEIVNYYDVYEFLNLNCFGSIKPSVIVDNNICTTSLQTAQYVATSDGGKVLRVMLYDEKGRAVDVLSSFSNGTVLKTHTNYSFTDKPTLVNTTLTNGRYHYSVADSIQYDMNSDMMLKELLSIQNQDFVTLSDNEYDGLGRLLTSKVYDGSIINNYFYDVHGWQTRHDVYDSKIHQSPIFREELYYASGPGTPCYNGNISSAVYSGFNDKTRGFKYKYDGMDRLTEAKYYEGYKLENTPRIDYSEIMTYNENSAITSLKRWSELHTGASALVDDLVYSYVGNRLSSITDNGRTNYKEGAFDHKGSKSNYSYDTCGSLTSDTGKGINRIEYDVNGMPSFIKFTNGNETEYVYTSDGVKLKTIHRTAVNGIPDERDMPRLTPQQILSADSTIYIGNFEFYNTLSSNGKYYFPNGFVSLLDGNHLKYNFMATDHLGNTRAVISTTNYSDEHKIEQKNSYYAYGGIMDDVAEGVDVQTHKYNGKELDRMHGLDWYDYHARQYDGIVNQFWSMDPLCEKYYHISPYVYCAGNPVNYIDPDGRYITITGENMDGILQILQSLVGNSATLSLEKGGRLVYQKNNDSDGNEIASNENADFIFSTIDDNRTNVILQGDNDGVVNINGKDGAMFGGAFGGNSFEYNDDGSLRMVNATQFINVSDMNNIASETGVNTCILHEIEEGLQGASIARTQGKPLTQSDYSKAHNAAELFHPQGIGYTKVFCDIDGKNIVNNPVSTSAWKAYVAWNLKDKTPKIIRRELMKR